MVRVFMLLVVFFRGFYIFFSLFLLFCGWITSIWSNFLCNSVKYTPKDESSVVLPSGFELPTFIDDSTTLSEVLDSMPDLNMGLWYHKGWTYYLDYYGNPYLVNTCTSYNNDVEIDSKWKTARVS